MMRMGKLTSGSFLGAPSGEWTFWARRAVSLLALLASLTALALILDSRYGEWSSAPRAGAAASETDTAGADTVPAAATASVSHTPAEEGRYRALSGFVAKRYRVSQDVAFDLVSHAHRVGRELQLDPLLIIAVISVESRFNPIAESGAGAKGLMQIIPKYHGDKLEEFGGEQAVFNPTANIVVGSQILREYIRRTGNVNIALQMYAGALGDYEDQYTRKVLTERQRLQQVVSKLQGLPARATAVKTAATTPRSGNPLVLPPELD